MPTGRLQQGRPLPRDRGISHLFSRELSANTLIRLLISRCKSFFFVSWGGEGVGIADNHGIGYCVERKCVLREDIIGGPSEAAPQRETTHALHDK